MHALIFGGSGRGRSSGGSSCWSLRLLGKHDRATVQGKYSGSQASDGGARTAGPVTGGANPGGSSRADWGVDQGLLAFLQQNRGEAKYLVAVQATGESVPIILATGEPVVTLGEYKSQDPFPPVTELEKMVTKGELRYVWLTAGSGGAGSGSSASRKVLQEVVNWVKRRTPRWSSQPPTAPRRRVPCLIWRVGGDQARGADLSGRATDTGQRHDAAPGVWYSQTRERSDSCADLTAADEFRCDRSSRLKRSVQAFFCALWGKYRLCPRDAKEGVVRIRAVGACAALAVLMLLVAVWGAAGCAGGSSTSESGNVSSTGTLPQGEAEIEATEFQGVKLTPLREQGNNALRGTQFIDKEAYRLVVDGLVEHPLSLSYADLQAYEQESWLMDMNCVEGWGFTAKWTGPSLPAILADAGVKPEAVIAIFHTADVEGGYTSLPLDYIRENNILLALKINDITLPPERGFPFQVVAKDKYGYKWAKWVTRIELSSDSSFRGYWERAGYNNNADQDGPAFE